MIASSFSGAIINFSKKLGFREGKWLFCQISQDNSPTKRAVIAKLLDLDIRCKKVFWSAYQDATFVKISCKSEHFYFWGDQIRDSRTLEFWVREMGYHKNSPIPMKFSQKLRLEKLVRKLFYRESLNTVVLQLQPVLWGCNPGNFDKITFFPSRNPPFSRKVNNGPRKTRRYHFLNTSRYLKTYFKWPPRS